MDVVTFHDINGKTTLVDHFYKLDDDGIIRISIASLVFAIFTVDLKSEITTNSIHKILVFFFFINHFGTVHLLTKRQHNSLDHVDLVELKEDALPNLRLCASGSIFGLRSNLQVNTTGVRTK